MAKVDLGSPPDDIMPLLEDDKCYHVVFLWHVYFTEELTWPPDHNTFIRDSRPDEIHGQGVWTNIRSRWSPNFVGKILAYERTPAYIEFHEPPDVTLGSEWWNPKEYGKFKANFKAWALINDSLQIPVPNGLRYSQNFLVPWHRTGTGAFIRGFIERWRPVGQIWDISVYQIPCPGSFDSSLPRKILLLDGDGSRSGTYSGTASPPPPPPRKMCGCDCNTIASIIAEQMVEKQRLLDALKEHVDIRSVEQLEYINKMLQDIDMSINLQPVIDEVRQVRTDLWDGNNGG